MFYKSKSSLSSLYSITCFLIDEPSTHVTKSSNVLLTKKAGSLITCGPTLTCPCSIKSVAFFIFSDILLRTITTGRRLRQNELAEIFAALFKSHFVGIKPITYNFSSNCALASVLNCSCASI